MGTAPNLYSTAKLLNDAFDLNSNTINTSVSGATITTGDNTGVKGIRVFIGPTDPISDIPVIIDLAHHQIHEGETHQYTYPPAPIGNGATLNILFKCGNLSIVNNQTANVVYNLDAAVETWIYLYETPTTTANGTLQSSRNRNRNKLTAPGSSVYLTPTVTATGTLLNASISGGGKSSGNKREENEWIFKPNTDYLFQIISKNTGNNICFTVTWYEDLGV